MLKGIHQVARLESCISLPEEIHERIDEIRLLKLIPEHFLKTLANNAPKIPFEQIEKCRGT